MYRVSGSVEWLAVGDLNGTGQPDIVTANDLPDESGDDDEDDGDDDAPTVSGTVSTLINRGDGKRLQLGAATN